MSAISEAISPSSNDISAPESGQRVILHGISWETYESLLADQIDNHSAHFAYDQGYLEIMVLSDIHEELNRTLALLVEVVAEEMSIDVRNFGSKTFKRNDLAKGFEPDSCFYIQNESLVWGKQEIDLAVDPAPDLVIEIDITSPSLKKTPIYAALGISEIWRYDGTRLTISVLQDNDYKQHTHSLALPVISDQMLTQFMQNSRSLKRTAWLRSVRQWVQQNQPEQHG
jgi:Uma2 family endonuclease